MRSGVLRIACVVLIGCRDDGREPTPNRDRVVEVPAIDAGRADAARADPPDVASLDTGSLDAGSLDAGSLDAARAATVRGAASAALVPADAGKPLGKHGDVCRSADGKPNPLDEGRTVVECGPELSCCYPCGIAGCAWVCHTAAECDADLRRP